MAGSAAQLAEIFDQVAATNGFSVESTKKGGLKVTAPDGRTLTRYPSAVATNYRVQNLYRDLRNELKWTPQLYKKQVAEDHERRLEAGRDRYNIFAPPPSPASPAPPSQEGMSMGPVSVGGMEITVERITPEIALEYLAQAERAPDEEGLRQRRVSKVWVKRFAAYMARDAWMLTHEGIVFDTDGYLIDGQTRLHACIDADRPFTTLVFRKADRRIFAYLNQGRTRTVSDILYMDGETNTKQLSAALRNVHLFYEAVDPTQWDEYQMTPEDALKLRDDYPDLRDELYRAHQVRRLKMSPTAATVGGYIIRNAWPEAPVDEFFDRLGSGDGLVKGDPILTFRNYLVEGKDRRSKLQLSHSKLRTRVHLHLLVRAWNASVTGRAMYRISPRPPFAIPEPYRPTVNSENAGDPDTEETT